MSGIGSGYDLSPGTYSPDGRVFQTEYAQKAVDNAGTMIGVKCRDGVVLGLEKLVPSKLLVPGSNKRIYHVDKHIGAAVVGLAPDGRQIVNDSVGEASNYKSVFGGPIPGAILADRVANYMHLFNLYWSTRPFGAAVLYAVYDSDGPALYLVEPSGISQRYFGTAVGKGRQAAKTEIEKLKMGELSCREALVEVAKILHKVHDEDGKPFELELSWICEETDKEHRRISPELVAEVERQAKAALEESDMDED
ncbi:hypothetical protein BSKO_02265 [Bryopsis sp. KO-2023]|nr:hypothetical protein BSKO_02265 [Bryopsis sp. KO-2023]